MKLACVKVDGQAHVALVAGEELIDLTARAGVSTEDLPKLLSSEGTSLGRRYAEASGPRIAISAVQFLSPILHGDKILGVAMNYHSFVEEAAAAGLQTPPGGVWFYRPRSCLVGPRDDVWLPKGSTDCDYEAELAVVISRRCRYVTKAEASSVIGGFTVANDISLRGRGAQSMVFANSFDTHTPLGPWIVTADEIEDPHTLAVRTWVNGKLRQNSSTADMVADCHELVAQVSAHCTLNPGDLILTGTPAGCGALLRPPVMLAAGDVVRIEIQAIGALENKIIEEPVEADALLTPRDLNHPQTPMRAPSIRWPDQSITS